MKKNEELIGECREAWEALEPFRRRRRRCVNFAYGRQWCDVVRLPGGKLVDEKARWTETGREPLSNNLIRRMIKTVTGLYRTLLSSENAPDGPDNGVISLAPKGVSDALWNLDSRSLEEFLISGCVVNRIDTDLEFSKAEISNRNPERVFFKRFMEPDASDCRFVGMLHDFTLTRLLRAFGHGNASRVRTLLEAAGKPGMKQGIPFEPGETDFFTSDTADTFRIVEVWRKDMETVMRVADMADGKCYSGLYSAEVARNVEDFNKRRSDSNKPGLACSVEITESWTETWMTTSGMVLAEKTHTPRTSPPIVIQAYPMIGGETHSAVEDLLDQQKYINRLVMLLDDVLASSAKGVILFPSDQLPENITWAELRKIWAQPSGVIPFRRTSKTVMPQQINGSGSFSGAVDMLRTQLGIFDEIAGTDSSRPMGTQSASGADMLRQQRESALVAMLDVLFSFRTFTERRNNQLMITKRKQRI